MTKPLMSSERFERDKPTTPEEPTMATITTTVAASDLVVGQTILTPLAAIVEVLSIEKIENWNQTGEDFYQVGYEVFGQPFTSSYKAEETVEVVVPEQPTTLLGKS